MIEKLEQANSPPQHVHQEHHTSTGAFLRTLQVPPEFERAQRLQAESGEQAREREEMESTQYGACSSYYYYDCYCL